MYALLIPAASSRGDGAGRPPTSQDPRPPPELLGRRSECEALDRLLADALAGQSRVTVLRGEAGAGKSALLGYLSDRAAGWHVARAVGVESEMELAYAGLHQLCAPMLDQLGRLPGPQRDALATVFGRSAGAHMYLGEGMVAGGFGPWRAAIDKVEALGPRHIVAGHQDRRLDDDAGRTIAETRQYLDDADELLRSETTAVGFFSAKIERYPDHLARTVLWAGASALYGVREHPGEDAEHLAQILVAGWL